MPNESEHTSIFPLEESNEYLEARFWRVFGREMTPEERRALLVLPRRKVAVDGGPRSES